MALRQPSTNIGVRSNGFQTITGIGATQRQSSRRCTASASCWCLEAECLIRQGSPALARPLIALVRERAGLTTPENVDLEMLDQELLHEFTFEGHRRTDNIRMGDFFEPWWNKGTTPEFRGVYPIPKVEMEKNSKLVQNEGY